MKITTIPKRLLLAFALCAAPVSMFGQAISIGISIHTAPPPLPVYAQPPCPMPGYLWVPGYWAWAPAGYYWVPGVWVAPPRPGLLWTPGYWGFVAGAYGWHPGYWGPHVGFYGGVNYGFGYTGVGFVGGMWAGNVYRYNTAITNVNTTVIRNTYVNNVTVNNVTVNRASFNGPGGIAARPSTEALAAEREQHIQATSMQLSHQQNAGASPQQFARANGGRPPMTAMNEVNGRRFDQQGRVANGVSSGQLTSGETRNLERRESNLNNTIRNDRPANGGTLTPQERQNINQRQNNLNRSIYDDKHNAATEHYGNNEVGQRRENQQERIGQGIRSGQITPNGAARTERREQSINRGIAADRAANGGRLNNGERANINRRQNEVGHQIEREEHNNAHERR